MLVIFTRPLTVWCIAALDKFNEIPWTLLMSTFLTLYSVHVSRWSLRLSIALLTTYASWHVHSDWVVVITCLISAFYASVIAHYVSTIDHSTIRLGSNNSESAVGQPPWWNWGGRLRPISRHPIYNVLTLFCLRHFLRRDVLGNRKGTLNSVGLEGLRCYLNWPWMAPWTKAR